jgi:large subunit ribosomal protein L3
MAGVFTPEGQYVAVTVLEVGPCVVTQVKTEKTDGYNALQLGFGTTRKNRINKPLKGHFNKSKQEGFAYLREVAVDAPEEYSAGQTINLELFKVGEKVDVVGTMKGRGFSGVVKRHGFHGGKKTHGSHSTRDPGSIGTSAWPSRVTKGKKMPGQYGNSRKTIRNLEIVDVRLADNLLYVKGAIPGFKSSLVIVNKLKIGK